MQPALSRRSFLALSASVLAYFAVPAWTWADEQAAKNGAVVIVHTNDVHCAYAQAAQGDTLTCFGYDGLAGYVAELRAAYSNVALVDAGDAVQGQAAGTLSEGEYLIDIMNACGYDMAVPGNHEFDFGMDQFNKLDRRLNAPYISCNFNRQGSLLLSSYLIKEYEISASEGAEASVSEGTKETKRVAFVGMTTPATLTSCSPTSFKENGDPAGETIYGFCEDETGQALYDAVQSAVDDALSPTGGAADYVVVVAHLGQTGAPQRWRSDVVAEHTSGIDVIIDGHSHEEYVQVVQNKAGKNVIISQTGTQLAGIGRVILDPASGTVAAATANFHEQAVTSNCPQTDALLVTCDDEGIAQQAATWAASDGAKEASAAVQEVSEKVDAIAGKKVGYSKVKLWATEEDEYTWAVRTHETNCGDFVTDAYWNVAYQAGAIDDYSKLIAMVNGGGVRANLEVGEVTYGDLIAVNPFNNQLCYASVTGQQILDALEMCLRAALACDDDGNVLDPMQLSSSGSFPHVSGLTCDVHIDIPSTVTTDASGNFTGVSGERRVRNVKVAGNDLDPNATYTLVSHAYWLVDNGSGLSMFAGLDVVYLGVDNQALIAYIDMLDDDTISDYYADPAGTGRIVLKTAADPDDPDDDDDDDGGDDGEGDGGDEGDGEGGDGGEEDDGADDDGSGSAIGDDTTASSGKAYAAADTGDSGALFAGAAACAVSAALVGAACSKRHEESPSRCGAASSQENNEA